MREATKAVTNKTIKLLSIDLTWWILAVSVCLLFIGHRQGLAHSLTWDLDIALMMVVISMVMEGL